jgi:hypothetical protein
MVTESVVTITKGKALCFVGPVRAVGKLVGPVIERSLVRFDNRIGQSPYFEPHYHQLVRWCQYNVTSRP